MRRDREDTFDEDQPTLIVTYGTTTRKYRPLDREVIVLGRAPNCDLNLMGTEVAPIHCLLVRCAGGGWHVRHYGGRIGTLVNGKSIVDEKLDHDDTIQIGSFSFKLHLPPSFRRPGLTADVPPDSVEASHLRRSRRNLVRLALSLRRNCQELGADLARAEQQSAQLEQDLNALRDTARSRQQALDALRAKCAADEAEFLRRCQTLDKQEADLAANKRAVEAELAERANALMREREELQRRLDENRPMATPALRERLAKVQKLKNGLAMLRGDSAPGNLRAPESDVLSEAENADGQLSAGRSS